MSPFTTPILFLVFNRPNETERVFEAIRKIAPQYLYIAADGPRHNREGETALCGEVKNIVNNIDWDCEVKALYRGENLGCKRAVSEAITWFFENVEQGIILEDDCLPDSSFFPYCEQLLEEYKYDESIISIGGTNLGYTFSGNDSYAFSRFMNMWGWATWRRSSMLVDYDMEKWKNMRFKKLFLHRKLQDSLFLLDYNWIQFWKKYFDLTQTGKMDTWDYQWIFTQLYYSKKSIFPAQNLIKNIGFAENATHTHHPGHPISMLPLQTLKFPLHHPNNSSINKVYESDYIKKEWFTYNKASLYAIIRSKFLNQPGISKIIQQLKKGRAV